MYLIVVYDCKEDRTRVPRKFLRQYLIHVQNSVFEGNVTKGQYKEIRDKLEEHHIEGESIILFSVRSEKYCDREVFGEDPTDNHQFI